MWNAITSGGEWWGELCNRKKNGELYWEYGSVSAVKNESGVVTHYLAVKDNITERKYAEEALRRYATELEQRNRELDAYSNIIAHDLKNPLGVILGYIELIKMDYGSQIPEDAIQYVERIKLSAEKMLDMIHQLLHLARLRNATDTVIPIDIFEVATAAVTRFENQIDQSHVQLQIQAMPEALGHFIWIEEVFANLIGNAIKYKDKAKPVAKIVITGYRQDRFVRFEVQDNGLGIPLEAQNRLFEMFSRFHTKEAPGFGLGLAIVQQIISKLGGQIGVESTPGVGSTFWFTLPGVPEYIA